MEFQQLADLMKAPEGLKRDKCNRNSEVAATPTEERNDSMEKVDVSPENNTKKDTPPEINGRMTTSASAILANHTVQCSEIPKSLSLFEVCSQVPPVSPKNSMAFTIDFGGPADEQRYRNMYEKFQNRHRRGTSLTKFDDVPQPRTKIPMSAKLPRKQIPVPIMRDKNRLQAQDTSKRHSWSPRSSIAAADISTKFTPRSLTLTKALKGNKNEEITCSAPPLVNPQCMGEDQVSEAGTYTLDADNYTEEQKERMNIDLSDDMEELKIRERPKRPNFFQTNLETFDNDLSQRYQESDCPYDGKSVRKNILEISCSHETSTAKPKVSYLERLKNRVKNISDRTFHKSRSPDKLLPSPDVGTFTSVTTSGILSVKHTLENNPRLTRRNSLTKSQIDNSEYVQGVSRLNVNSSEERSVRSPKRSNETSLGATSIKSAATKNDWIQEWARHARQHSAQMSRSFESPSEDLSCFPDTMSRSEYVVGYTEGSFMRSQLRASMQGRFEGTYSDVSERRRLEKHLPLSPTKIPSPVGSLQKRPRSRSSSTRSPQGSLTDDTDVYLQKTAAAITTLQKIHRHSLQNSPKIPKVSPVVPTEEYLLMQLARMQRYHRRNHSLDGIETPVKAYRRHHTRHYSYESNDNHPLRCDNTVLYADRQSFIDTDCASDVAKKSSIKQTVNALPQKGSPIRRSTSFNAKTPNQTGTPKMPSKNPQRPQSIQKSASSNNFRTVVATYGDDDIMEFIINDNVDLDAEQFASDSDTNEPPKPISNTRYNKAFLMRMEQNRRPAAKQGMIACPNTPEMRRREPNVRQSLRERMSMPRDSSLNRMKQDLARRQQPKEQTPKVQPRYMDISKYKPVTGANFLKKDESKSYILHKEVKKSPSSASVNLSRGDASRVSNRSIKSAGMRPSSGKKDPLVPVKQTKEAELAMWKRRASYDPMKAALEGKRKQDEAKRLAQQQQSKFGESSSAVLRSQSFHSGVSSHPKTTQMAKTTIENQWTARSESSDDNES